MTSMDTMKRTYVLRLVCVERRRYLTLPSYIHGAKKQAASVQRETARMLLNGVRCLNAVYLTIRLTVELGL